MKKIFTYTSLIAALIATMGCRDVTENDMDGSGTQESDPVLQDKPVVYVQRPVPTGFLDDDDLQESILPNNVLSPSESRGGAVLMLKERASVSAETRALTEGIFPLVDGEEPLYDVRDLSTNEDGDKLAFAMRGPIDPNEDEDDPDNPTWNIWEYDYDSDSLNRVIESDLIAEQGNDRYPIYMPDDSIIFSSDRQATSRVLMTVYPQRAQYSYVTEGDDEVYAFTLHKIDEDRVDIEQISYGKGHDIQPTLLSDGRVLFLRWDDTSNQNDDRLSLYTINPDGSNLSMYYGFHSDAATDNDDQGALTKPIQMDDGRILVSYRPRETTILGGDIVRVDGENYIDNTQPTAANIGATGPAENSLSVGEVILEAQSPQGYFNSAYPLDDGSNRLLVSWMPCLVLGYGINIYVQVIEPQDTDDDGEPDTETRYLLIDVDGNYVDEDGDRLSANADPVEIFFDELASLPCSSETFNNPTIQPAEPQFGIWVLDTDDETLSPVVLASEIGTMFTDAVVLERRTPADIISNTDNLDLRLELIDEQVGVLHIRSVYDFDGVDTAPSGIAAMADPLQTAPDNRPIRFVRFYEEASMPHEDDHEIEMDAVSGRFNNPGRSIIGYAEVHPDGSVMTKVPANTAFSMEFVDANGRRVTGQYAQRHNNWLSVRPGEIRTCNGCHTPGSTAPHGRLDAEPESANPGALAAANFPNTQLYDSADVAYSITPDIGETMAEYYVRVQRLAFAEEDPLLPSLDLNYTDVWTEVGTPGTDISIEFGDPTLLGPDNLLTLAPVPRSKCLTEWTYDCRTVIDYPDHIQPVFEVARSIDVNAPGPMGDPLEDGWACLDCHSITGPAPDNLPQIPAGPEGFQFDFRNEISELDDDMILLRGYDEFFAAGDVLREENPDTMTIEIQQIPLEVDGVTQYQETPILDLGGNATFEFIDTDDGSTVCMASGSELLDDTLTPVLDPDTNLPVACIRRVCTKDTSTGDYCPESLTGIELFDDTNGNGIPDRGEECTVDPQPICVQATQERYLNAAGANNGNNRRFFNAFGEGGAHEGYLTPAEVKLFSEWLDVGSQFQNEIFKARVE